MTTGLFCWPALSFLTHGLFVSANNIEFRHIIEHYMGPHCMCTYGQHRRIHMKSEIFCLFCYNDLVTAYIKSPRKEECLYEQWNFCLFWFNEDVVPWDLYTVLE
jgi:hypothetical protein